MSMMKSLMPMSVHRVAFLDTALPTEKEEESTGAARRNVKPALLELQNAQNLKTA